MSNPDPRRMPSTGIVILDHLRRPFPKGVNITAFGSEITFFSIPIPSVVMIPDFAMRYISRYLGHDATRIAILVYRLISAYICTFSL